MKRYIAGLGLLMLLGGCLASGPENNLNELAKALENKDSALFMAQMDMRRFAEAKVNNMTQASEPLRTLDSVGRMLGLGGMEDLLGTVMDTQNSETARLSRGVSTGELMLDCSRAEQPNCPWVPSALRSAKVKELSPVAAVAQITAPTNISSWLALAKVGDAWKVVGQAPLEAQAAQYALGSKQDETGKASSAPKAPADAPAAPPAPMQKPDAKPTPQDKPAPPPPAQDRPQAPVRL